MRRKKIIGAAVGLCALVVVGFWVTWDPPGTQEEAAILVANGFSAEVQRSFMDTLAVGKSSDDYSERIAHATGKAMSEFELVLGQGRVAPFRLRDDVHEDYAEVGQILASYQVGVEKDESRKEMAISMATHRFGILLQGYHKRALARLKEEIRNTP